MNIEYNQKHSHMWYISNGFNYLSCKGSRDSPDKTLESCLKEISIL